MARCVEPLPKEREKEGEREMFKQTSIPKQLKKRKEEYYQSKLHINLTENHEDCSKLKDAVGKY